MRARIYSHKRSGSVKRLCAASGIKRIRTKQASRYRPREGDVVFNWGCSHAQFLIDWDVFIGVRVLNLPSAVAVAVDKSYAFVMFDAGGISHVPFTLCEDDARERVARGKVVVCRTTGVGHSGDDIVLATTPEEVVSAPLYTEYVKKRDEFRVHVFDGRVIDVQRKMRASSVPNEDVNWRIRTHGNGFVFGRNDVTPDDSVIEEAINAVQVLSLDFGAVDVIWNEHNKQAYVLEVNTAPNLVGTTVIKYAEAFNGYIGRS